MHLFIDITAICGLSINTDPLVSVSQKHWVELYADYPDHCYGDPQLVNVAPSFTGSMIAPNPYRIDLSGALKLSAPNDPVAVSKDQWHAFFALYPDHCFGGESSGAQARSDRARKVAVKRKVPLLRVAEDGSPYPTLAEQDGFFASICARRTHGAGYVALSTVIGGHPDRIDTEQEWLDCIYRNTGPSKAYYIEDGIIHKRET